MFLFLTRRDIVSGIELINPKNLEIMNTQSQQSDQVRIYKANNKNDIFKNDTIENHEVNILKDWYQKMMPNYEKEEIWLDDSIEPVKWQDTKMKLH